MKTNRVIQIIAGIVMIVGGMICIGNPIESDLLLMWVVIVSMLVNAISSIFTWGDKKRAGLANGWNLAGSIISLVFALFLLVNVFAQIILATAIIYVVMAWMIIGGIMQIIAAVNLRKIRKAGAYEIGRNWGLLFAFGIIMILAGLFGFARPLGMAIALGWIIGINLVTNGINLLVFSGDHQ